MFRLRTRLLQVELAKDGKRRSWLRTKWLGEELDKD
jgi:hypothetical protein